jgi:hypothetical protein
MSNVGSVGAIGTSAVGSIHAAFSPFLNGVRRTSDAAAAAALQATVAAKSAAATAAAVAARASAAATVAAAPPFLNPAITEIADQTALGETLTSPVATTPDAQPAPVAAQPPVLPTAQPPVSATDSVLHGDSGTLVQSYGAVALLAGPVALTALYGLPQAPAIPAVAAVPAIPRLARVENTGVLA